MEFLLRELADRRDFFRIGQLDRHVTAKLNRIGDDISKFGFDLVGGFQCVHRRESLCKDGVYAAAP